MLVRVRESLIAILLVALAAPDAPAGAQMPRPPCKTAPYPDYPVSGDPPNFVRWTSSELNERWIPPECTQWKSDSATFVVALAGHFSSQRDGLAMLAAIGAISSLRKVQYWSVTDGRWNTMFPRATALDGPDLRKPRGDFSSTELRSTNDRYFLASDNRSQEDVIWRLHLREYADNRIVLETSNATPIGWYFLEFVAPGNIDTLYFLQRDSDGSWRLYSLTRALYTSPLLAYFISSASYLNRAVALYNHYAGIENPPNNRDNSTENNDGSSGLKNSQ